MLVFNRALSLGSQKLRERQADCPQGPDLEKIAAGYAVARLHRSTVRKLQHGDGEEKRGGWKT